MNAPLFVLIKDHIVQQIEHHDLVSGDRVPSENELCALFSVSRMTARRALQELSDEGVLVRTQGLGTFVADSRPMSSMLEIRNIAEEILARGHSHRSDVIVLEAVVANQQQAVALDLTEGSTIFHSIIVHWENDHPLQFEERFVNPLFGPDYLLQDFRRTTASAYLSAISPLTEADHVVEAILVDPQVASLLQVELSEPCLKLNRRTWCQRGIVNIATLIYPGSRYRIGGHLNF